MIHKCLKCNNVAHEINGKFCHYCIAKKAFQIYRRTGKEDAVANWFWAIEELTCETKPQL